MSADTAGPTDFYCELVGARAENARLYRQLEEAREALRECVPVLRAIGAAPEPPSR
jgi:hypothetical protein